MAKRKKTNKDLIFLLGLGLIFTIINYIIVGLLITIFIDVGIAIILFLSKIIGKMKKKKSTRKLVNLLIILFLLGCIGLAIGGTIFIFYVIKEAPEFDPNKLVYSESTLIYDKDQNLIAELGTEKREIITYDQMSEVLVDALIATEDSRYFQHNGIDAARFIKASIGQAFGKSDAGGASTLSMQVIKNSFTSKEASGIKGIIRKFTDIYLAVFKLEKNFTKEEIIEYYVNNHFLGNNSYGVEQAAKTYFGKKAKDLNLAEASLLVGLFKAPSAYNPYLDNDAAEQRRATVLNLMYKHGYITKEEMELAKSIPISSLIVKQASETQKFQGYIDTVVEELDKKYNVNPYNTPMKVYTNMDSAKQQKIDDIFAGKSSAYKWKKDYYQAGAAAIDVNTGKIIAIGAGRNRTGASSYNFATMIDRQIGSTSKPILDYAPGMEYLGWSTATIFDDSPYTYSNGVSIKDSDGKYWGKMTIRDAISYSRNIPALKAFQEVKKKIGEDKLKQFISNFGITTEKTLHEAHSIGSFNGKNPPVVMAAAYAVFANGGYYYEPYSVSKIIYRDTGEVIEYKSEPKKVISDSTAYMITQCLITAVESGYSSEAKIKGYTIASKTGTTNYDDATGRKYNIPYNAVPDGLQIGYDPEVSIAVWFGVENALKDHKFLDATDSVVEKGRLFRELSKILMTPGKNFTMPKSVVKVAIEKGSNPPQLASSSTPSNQKTYEYFKKGTEPTETSNKYNKQSNVTDLSVTYDASSKTVSIDWSGVADNTSGDKSSYGKFGYKVYKDGSLLGFTTDTSYNIYDVSNPDGTYKVVTTYENYSGNASSGVSYKYTTQQPVTKKELKASLKYQVSTYNVGDTLASYDMNPSQNDVTITYGETDVTNDASISISITDQNGNTYANIDSSAEAKYQIKYQITYNSETITVTRKINIGG